MKLNLQSRVNYQSTHEQRELMIKEEKLHIQDSITYDLFCYLHEKYASKLDEKEFARYFLDIDYRSYYNLQTGYRKETVILEREFYIEEEFDEIRERMIQELRLNIRL